MLSSIAKVMAERGMRVVARLTVGERVHRFSAPNDLIRRKSNQEELLSWLEHRPTKLPPKAAEELKNIFGKPADSFDLSILDKLNEAIESVEDTTKLKDVASVSSIAPVKDADINVKQFKRILVAALEEKARRAKTLQDLLKISDDDLSVKNLKRYLANVDREISNKSNYFDVTDREITDEIKLPKITHKELSFTDNKELPRTISAMVRQFQMLHGNEPSLEDAIDTLFSGVDYKVFVSLRSPLQTAPEIGNIRENLVHVLDKLTSNTWESGYTLVTVRSMKQVMLVGFEMHETQLVKKGLVVYKKKAATSTRRAYDDEDE